MKRGVIAGIAVLVVVLSIFLIFSTHKITTGLFIFPSVIGCEDSDGGLNYDEPGIVVYTYKWGRKIRKNEYTDRCYKGGKYIKEFYCKNDRSRYELYSCPEGCKDGACIKLVMNCTDSDGGLNYAEKGKLKAYVDDKGWVGWFDFEDYCSGDLLYEYTCNNFQAGEKPKPIEKFCRYGCENGACEP